MTCANIPRERPIRSQLCTLNRVYVRTYVPQIVEVCMHIVVLLHLRTCGIISGNNKAHPSVSVHACVRVYLRYLRYTYIRYMYTQVCGTYQVTTTYHPSVCVHVCTSGRQLRYIRYTPIPATCGIYQVTTTSVLVCISVS